MISGWVAEKGLHMTLNIGMWSAHGRNEPAAWGIFLADSIKHIASALEQELGQSQSELIHQIRMSLDHELADPTSPVTGSFHVGNN